jgi:hypothetical protein
MRSRSLGAGGAAMIATAAMGEDASLVERVRTIVATRDLGEQLWVAALLERRSGLRYREWAADAVEPRAAGFLACARREEAIAERARTAFAGTLREPADREPLLARIQAEVAAVFGGRGRAEQYRIQARAERDGERFWTELAAATADPDIRASLLECAALEAESAAFLEGLGNG